jgi:hypothetical protein
VEGIISALIRKLNSERERPLVHRRITPETISFGEYEAATRNLNPEKRLLIAAPDGLSDIY